MKSRENILTETSSEVMQWKCALDCWTTSSLLWSTRRSLKTWEYRQTHHMFEWKKQENRGMKSSTSKVYFSSRNTHHCNWFVIFVLRVLIYCRNFGFRFRRQERQGSPESLQSFPLPWYWSCCINQCWWHCFLLSSRLKELNHQKGGYKELLSDTDRETLDSLTLFSKGTSFHEKELVV